MKDILARIDPLSRVCAGAGADNQNNKDFGFDGLLDNQSNIDDGLGDVWDDEPPLPEPPPEFDCDPYEVPTHPGATSAPSGASMPFGTTAHSDSATRPGATSFRSSTARSGAAPFQPPTAEEVRRYCAKESLLDVDPERFVDYYDANGWMCGKNPMVNWQAVARNWQRNKKPEPPARKEPEPPDFRPFD